MKITLKNGHKKKKQKRMAAATADCFMDQNVTFKLPKYSRQLSVSSLTKITMVY